MLALVSVLRLPSESALALRRRTIRKRSSYKRNNLRLNFACYKHEYVWPSSMLNENGVGLPGIGLCPSSAIQLVQMLFGSNVPQYAAVR